MTINTKEGDALQTSNTPQSPDVAQSTEAPRRVRYETKRRELQVASKTYLTPGLLRIVLHGDLSGFQSQGFDDHIKLIFPDPETGIVTLPGEAGSGESGGPRPLMRDYTPRLFDVAAGQLVIDFALHGIDSNAGPATRWAVDANVGDHLHVAGPRGSQLLPTSYQHYVLIGDDTAIPAITRRLEELPADKLVTAIIEVDGPENRLPLEPQSNATIHWVYRAQQLLLDALAQLNLSTTNTHFWVASEREQTRAIRDWLQQQYNLPLSVIKASAYWHTGAAGKPGDVD